MWRILDLKEGHYVHSVHLKNPTTWEYYFTLSWYEQSCLDTMYGWLKSAYGFDIPLIDTKQQMIEIIMKDIESHIFGIYCDDFLLYLQDCIIENQYSFPTKQKALLGKHRLFGFAQQGHFYEVVEVIDGG